MDVDVTSLSTVVLFRLMLDRLVVIDWSGPLADEPRRGPWGEGRYRRPQPGEGYWPRPSTAPLRPLRDPGPVDDG